MSTCKHTSETPEHKKSRALRDLACPMHACTRHSALVLLPCLHALEVERCLWLFSLTLLPISAQMHARQRFSPFDQFDSNLPSDLPLSSSGSLLFPFFHQHVTAFFFICTAWLPWQSFSAFSTFSTFSPALGMH